MTSQDWVRPPRVAVWLVSLFAPADDAESISGDLLEEFSLLASKSGAGFARRWYWRQTLKTIAHLAAAAFRTAPWSTAAAVVAGFFLIGFGFRLLGYAIGVVLDGWVYGYLSDLGRQQPSRNVGADYMFWIMRATLIGRALVATLIGVMVAMAVKGREAPATIALALLMIVWGVAGSLMMVVETGYYGFLFAWTLPTVLADSIPIVVGGVIVRMRRSAAKARPSAT